jgi:predicted glycogen debranching enzyme
MICFDHESCRNLDSALQKEWLETNGLGGFASSTIAGLNTRRYHGLLTAAVNPPVGRMALLSKLEETVVIAGNRYDLSANQYPGAIHPQGHQYLKQFRLDPFPVFTYEVEGIEIEKSVFMIHGENSTVIQYELRGEATDCVLEVRPLIAFRDYHSTMHENGALNPRVEVEPNLATLRPYDGVPTLHLAHNAAELDLNGWWYRNFEYQVERERGLDFREDLFSPCALKFDLGHRGRAAIIASTEQRDVNRVFDYRQDEINRRQAALTVYPDADELIRTLVAAADQYIVARGDRKTVIAGYHWFGDWGRDTMIALPGLTLVTGRDDAAKSVLLAFAQFVDRGMLPNRFPDAGEEPEYNTVDATLWYFEALRALLQYAGDYEFIQSELYPVLTEIIDWHERGTRYGIRVDEDGLLHSGEPGVQLTWMDARVDGREVTPRTGKAVEIQALWYNALCVMEHLAHEFGDGEGEKRYSRMAARARHSFNELFWNEDAGCLFDVVDGEARDGSIRPNQIFAVSLTHTMLSREKSIQVVAVVERDLLTPYGLRSLSPNDPQYRGRYEGGPSERDGVYHQGTVWAWLMGPFITAYLKVNGNTRKNRMRAAQWLEAFHQHFREAGLGQVSEIFDGDAPHTARGCVAQAWSVAELLRAAAEDVYAIKPAKHKATVA